MYDYSKETRFFSVHFTNHNYTKHAGTLTEALNMGFDSGFEFSIWKDGVQYASGKTFGPSWVLVNGKKDCRFASDWKRGYILSVD